MRRAQRDRQPAISVGTKTTIVSLIGATHSRSGLRVRSEIDCGQYPGGVTVTHAQMATIHLTRHRFHGEWDYMIQPTSRR